MTALYINATGLDLTDFHEVIVAAIENGGEFGEDYSDVLALTKNPEGSGAEWRLECP